MGIATEHAYKKWHKTKFAAGIFASIYFDVEKNSDEVNTPMQIGHAYIVISQFEITL